MARPTLLLVDGHALVFRAFFGMPVTTTSRGEQTQVVLGFTNMLVKALSEHRPAFAIAAFDLPGPTFRHEEMAAYKAQRPPAPDEVRRQLPLCREVVEALGIPMVEMPGFEADDVIGTLSRRASVDAGLDVIILTGDLDALQLVDDDVRVLASRRGISELTVYDLAAVRERYGFDPPLIIDFKALQGDASDNIPGVPGIGEKTAKQLIQQYGPLESILAAVPAMKEGRVRRSLAEHMDQARLSKRMATIVRDLDVPFDSDQALLGGYDESAVRELFERLEFRGLLQRLPRVGHGPSADEAAPLEAVDAHASSPRTLPGQASLPLVSAPSGTDVVVVRDAVGASAAVAALRASAGVAVRSLVGERARGGRIMGIALACADDATRAWYVPLAHAGGAVDDVTLSPILALLEDASIPKTAWDVKRELVAWWARGVRPRGFDADLLLMGYLTTTRENVRLVQVIQETTGVRVEAEDDLIGSGRTRRSVEDLQTAESGACLGRIAALLGPVRTALDEALDIAAMRGLHDDMELPLVPILAAMETLGVGVRIDAVNGVASELADRLRALEIAAHELVGHPFNLGSVPQLRAVLFDQLGLAASHRTKTGHSTNAESLEALREEHPIADLILEWRQLRLLQSWVEALPEHAAVDGRVHTTFRQAVASTGRLSTEDPNLQNVPIRGEWASRLRAAFVPERPGQLLVSADYSQIELRVLAHVTNDATLVEAFRRGEDIHASTAARVYGVPLDAVTGEMRRTAKMVNFGVLYGLSEFGLARGTGMSREDARAFIEAYFRTFDTIASYQEQILNFARSTGYVETLFGRRRHLPNLLAAQRNIRQGAERQAINMPIQGTAADIMKLAMIRTDRFISDEGLQSRLLLQVHDELVLEAPAAEVDALGDLLRRAMGEAFALVVPLDVEVKVGPNWSALTPLQLRSSEAN